MEKTKENVKDPKSPKSKSPEPKKISDKKEKTSDDSKSVDHLVRTKTCMT